MAKRVRSLLDSKRNPLGDLMQEVGEFTPLSQGDPDLDTPGHIIEAAQRAAEEGYTHYTHPRGIPELRGAVAEKLAEENGITVDPGREIVVTTGAMEALFCVVQAVLDRGDELLVPDPYFTGYSSAVHLGEAVLAPVRTYEQDDFLLRPEALESQITPRSKALLIINPTMPASGLYSREALEELAAVAERHNLLVVSDELYEKILFNSAACTSIASLPGMASRTITINGFSKAYCMTGWRVGYAAGPASCIDAVAAVKESISICTPAVSQKAALAAQLGPQDFVQESLAIYGERRRVIMDRLHSLGISCGPWDAAHTVLANIQASGLSSVEFARRLLVEGHVYAAPGTAFGQGGEGYIRVSLLVPQPALRTALDELERVWVSLV
jgi:aspartate/methionine/tyrosine aminotransferase